MQVRKTDLEGIVTIFLLPLNSKPILQLISFFFYYCETWLSTALFPYYLHNAWHNGVSNLYWSNSICFTNLKKRTQLEYSELRFCIFLFDIWSKRKNRYCIFQSWDQFSIKHTIQKSHSFCKRFSKRFILTRYSSFLNAEELLKEANAVTSLLSLPPTLLLSGEYFRNGRWPQWLWKRTWCY